MTEIQKHIDDPVTFLFWEIDEAIAISACLFLGIVANIMITMILVSIGVSFILKKIKQRSSEGVMVHFLYWHGFLRLKGCPPSVVREIVG